MNFASASGSKWSRATDEVLPPSELDDLRAVVDLVLELAGLAAHEVDELLKVLDSLLDAGLPPCSLSTMLALRARARVQ